MPAVALLGPRQVGAGALGLFRLTTAALFHTNFAIRNELLHFEKDLAIAGGMFVLATDRCLSTADWASPLRQADSCRREIQYDTGCGNAAGSVATVMNLATVIEGRTRWQRGQSVDRHGRYAQIPQ